MKTKTTIFALIALFTLTLFSCQMTNNTVKQQQNYSTFAPPTTTEVETFEMYGEYLPNSCKDSTELSRRGDVFHCSKTVNTSSTSYQFNSYNSTCNITFNFTDGNGGNISTGDTLTVDYVAYDMCDHEYRLITTGLPTISVSGSDVIVTYTDCILPFDGTNGTVRVKFKQ